MSRSILTPKFRLSWPNVFARETKPDGSEGAYSIVMLFPKATTDMSELKAIMAEAVADTWPDMVKRPKTLRGAIRDGDVEKPDVEGYAGCWFCRASTGNIKPGVVDANVQPVIDPDLVYPGRWARAYVNSWTYSNSGNNGVSFGLIHLQILEDGDRFGAQVPKAEKVFQPVSIGAGVPKAAAVESMFT